MFRFGIWDFGLGIVSILDWGLRIWDIYKEIYLI